MAIKVSQAFERTSAQPIDTSLALTKAEMLAVNDNLMPAYYFTICQDDGKVYLYDKSATPSTATGKFTEFSGGGGGSSDVKFFTTTDTLSKDINGTKVVAAADLPGVTWSDLVAGSSVIKDAKGTMGLVTTITGTTSVTVTTATTSTPTVELTQAQYDALATKDPDTIYFITDSYVPSTYMGAYDTIYSTTERVVGSYMGKPLYQKTINFGALPNSVVKTVAHGISSLELVIDAIIMAKNGSSGINISIPYVNVANITYGCGFYVDSTNIAIQDASDLSAYDTCHVTIRYTKTTDTASAVEYATPNDYSTSEKIVGTWVDGKPVYQRTVVVTSNFDTNTTISCSPETLVSFDTIRKEISSGTTTYETGNFYAGSDDFFFGYGGISSDGKLYMRAITLSTHLSRLQEVRYTIRYTKTTD